jgi:hypothetical protein
LKVDISKEDELLFLIDTGGDISLLKGNKLIGTTETTEYDPEKKEGKMRRWVPDGNPWHFRGQNRTQQQFDCARLSVGKQVDIPCDGILGRDFLQRTRAKVCYESRTVTLNGETCKMVGKTKQKHLNQYEENWSN